MKRVINSIWIILLIMSFSCQNKTNSNYNCVDQIFIKMFKVGIDNKSTSPDYVLFNAVNRDKNIRKEICCTSDMLNYAFIMDKDSKIDTCTISIVLSDSAYNFLGADKYNFHFVDSLSRKIKMSTIDSIYFEHQSSGYSHILESYSIKYPVGYFEHILFRNKILTHRDCESGYTVISKKF